MPGNQRRAPAPAAPTEAGSVDSASFKRGYVACIGCRARKVRCVLGSKPPCAKCLREHRECEFQANHQAKKHRQAPKWSRTAAERTGHSQQSAHAGQQSGGQFQGRFSRELEHPSPQSASGAGENASSSMGDIGEPQRDGRDLRPEQSVQPTDPSGQAEQNNHDSSLTERVISSILTRPSDALDVLFDAVRSDKSWPGGGETATSSSIDGARNLLTPQASAYGNCVPSNNTLQSGLFSVLRLSQADDDVLDWWDKCRFVRQGWFTAQEAVTYLDLFYRCLAPHAAVLTDFYRHHEHHRQLVAEDPMLCCTILMISSRFFLLPGAGGVSRSHFIHNRLWQYCELLIRRLMFGQEKHSTAKTRVVGSIESLILISDWHPRSVHLPPDTEGWDSELISPDYDSRNRVQTDGDVPLIRWREDVFEPAKRSERMSWMLLGAGVNLAYELGVFGDSTSAAAISNDPRQISRAHRAGKLLYVHVTQMAVKMGCPSLLPENLSATASIPTAGESLLDHQWNTYMRLWVDLTRLMKTASAMFFQSMAYTKQQLQSGNYSLLLQHFGPSLVAWYEDFTAKSSDIPVGLKPLVLIEYHYLKAYTSALSVQAVVERAVARQVRRFADLAGEGLESCVLPQDHRFIGEVLTEGRRVLDIATSMAADGKLRYAPQRTLVCVTSSSVFLLKALSLSTWSADNHASLDAIDRCVGALRSSGTDDMDFSLRYATLIDRHVSRFRGNFPSQTSREGQPIVEGTSLPGSAMGVEAHLDVTHLQPSAPPPPSQFSAGANGESELQGFSDAGAYRMPLGEDWWTRPFDPSIAPFSSNGEGVSLGLELDSLDFLWNMPAAGEV